MILRDSAEEGPLRYGDISTVGILNVFSKTAILKYCFQNEKDYRSSEADFIRKHEILEVKDERGVNVVNLKFNLSESNIKRTLELPSPLFPLIYQTPDMIWHA